MRRAGELVGVGVAGVLLGLLLLVQGLLGRIPFGPRGAVDDLRIAAVHCLLAGYVPAALLYLRTRTDRTLRALRPVLDIEDAAFAREVHGGVMPGRGPLVAAILVGLTIAFLGPFLSGPGADHPWDPSTWTAEVVWHRVLSPFIGVGIGCFAAALVLTSRRLSRLADALKPLDLLNLRPLAPFTRQALTHALLTIGLMAVFGLFVVDQGVTPLFAAMLPATLGLAALSLLWPLRGVRRRIVAAKSAELAWADEQLRARVAALHAKSAEAANGRLADVVAYRRLIDDVPTWPFDQSTAVRFALYLLIPLASWVASALLGALVEGWFLR